MFEENLSAFFQPDEFAADATLNGVPVCGIFEKAYASAGSGLGMASTAPAYTLPSADVPAAPIGLRLVVDGIAYAVAEHEPDGTGISVLMLELAV